jgi:hypothetical protein
VLDPSFAHWPMPNPPSTGLPNPASYQWTEEVVNDLVTGLTWQRGGAPSPLDWPAANSYCEKLELGGYDDWRLPSRIELVSLVDFTHLKSAIDEQAFPKTASDYYFSATVNPAFGPNSVRIVSFSNGGSEWGDPTYPTRVRCVRVEPYPSAVAPPRYQRDASTVTDLGTGLMWERAIHTGNDAFFSQEDAMARCSDLALGGHDDWRAPSMKELLTWVDETHSFPCIDPLIFDNAIEAAWRFWSSSRTPAEGPVASSSPAWPVRMADGTARLEPKNVAELSICVRLVP